MAGRRLPGQRAGLTRAAVLTAAQELLAEQGLEALTMRGVARRLGVAPNALYSHTAGRTELVDALLDETLAAIAAPAADAADPLEALRALMLATYDVLLARPALVPAYLVRQGARGQHAVRLGATMDALLERSGLPAETVPETRRVLIVYTIGFAAFATAGPDGAQDRPLTAAQLGANFDRGLRWLLAGAVAEG